MATELVMKDGECDYQWQHKLSERFLFCLSKIFQNFIFSLRLRPKRQKKRGKSCCSCTTAIANQGNFKKIGPIEKHWTLSFAFFVFCSFQFSVSSQPENFEISPRNARAG